MFCTRCGKELPEGAAFCPGCGQGVKAEAAPVAVCHVDDEVRYLIPDNNYALVSYYVGLFSALFGIVLGPAAIVTGIKGIKYAKTHPEAHGRNHAVAGIVFGALGLLIWLFVAFLIVSVVTYRPVTDL